MIRSFVFIVISLILWGCGSSQIAGTEGGSSIEVVGYAGTVYGTAVQTNGAPVERGRAKLVDPRKCRTISSDYTTENGVFALPIRSPGDLGVFVYDSLDNGFYGSVEITSKEDDIDLDTVVLKPAGSISGTITCDDLSFWDGVEWRPEEFQVYVPELAEMIGVDTNGHFEISSIPEGTYSLNISLRYLAISDIREPAYFDTLISVESGEAVVLPEIRLQLEPLTVNDPLFTKDSIVVQKIFDLNNITTPVLKHCKLKRNRIAMMKLRGVDTIPPEIGELNSLERIEISRGDLKSLPAELAKCSNLNVIQIGFTQLKTVPYELVTLENIITLNLANNVLEEIPEFLMDMDYLPKVDLQSNSISPSDKERKWLLEHLFQNDSIQLAEWEATQSITGNTNKL